MSTRTHLTEATCLGQVELLIDGERLALGDDQRMTLATLVAVGPKGVSKGQFYSELFDGRPQRSGIQAAVMRIHRLRKKIEAAGVAALPYSPGLALV
jgi:hypothetical protein